MEDKLPKRWPVVKVPSEYIDTDEVREFTDFLRENLHKFPECVSEITFVFSPRWGFGMYPPLLQFQLSIDQKEKLCL